MKRFVYTVTTIAFLVAILKPRIEEMGIFRNVINFNNDRCEIIKGLESCEDIFVDNFTGLAYLACSQFKQRAYWMPSVDLFNFKKFSGSSTDYIVLLDLKTHQYRKLNLNNLPNQLVKDGIHLHGFDLFIHPSERQPSGSDSQISSQRKATLYFINHRTPTDGSSNPDVADSVVEVFDTFIGSHEATYRTSFKHDLILTPNNLVAMSENSFYITNDHAKKKHWTRMLDVVYPYFELDCVVYCSSKETMECKSAFRGHHPYPNGIAKGPNNIIYLVNTINAHLRFLEIQPDNTLKLKEQIKLTRNSDNIYVTQSGSVFVASIPRLLQFMNLFRDFQNDKPSLVSPSEVWKLSNDTSIQLGKNHGFKLEKIFGDDGSLVSGITSVAVWDSKLFLTGIGSAHVSVCEIEPEIAT